MPKFIVSALAGIIGATIWTNYRFGKVNLEQIISTVFMGGDGIFSSDISLIIELLAFSLSAGIILLILFKWLSKSGMGQLTGISLLLCSTIIAVITVIQFTPPSIQTRASTNNHLTTSVTTSANQDQPQKIQPKIYIPVEFEEITPPKVKRNLILIYVESLETAYRNENVFTRNLLSSLDSIKGVEFANYEQIFGTGWTMGAIVATQCGVPLRPSQDVVKFIKGDGVDGNTLGEKSIGFMNGFNCLGDILKYNGYTNVFLGGASGKFGGKHKFFKIHGYEQTVGREEWLLRGESVMNFWGLYDDRLFDQAKNKLAELQSKNKPFNMTILTVDTHHPLGFTNETCKKKYPNTNFEEIVQCASDLVADFVNYSLANYPNTDLVILGDHLAMQNPVYDKLELSKHRTIFNKFIFKKNLHKNRETLHHYSMLPTILYGMGFEFSNGRLALGQTGLSLMGAPISLDDVEMNVENSFAINKLYKNAWDAK
jgi:phosphoglycerol transferase